MKIIFVGKTFDYVVIGLLFALIVCMTGLQIIKNRELKTEIEELRIIVNQKFLPALILDQIDIKE